MEPRADKMRLFQTISSRSISDLSNYLSASGELYPSNSFGSSRNDESLIFRYQTNAATCIQSFVRGALCRQRVMEKIIMDSRTYAAGQIQQWYIRCVAIKEQKKRLAAKRLAATKIQSFWRMRITQQFLDILSKHVTKLQSIIRRRIALCKYIRAHKSIIIIQNQWRSSVLRENKRIEREKLKREKLEEAAAIRIQSIARKYIQERSFLFQKNFGLTGDSEFALRRVRSESESEAEAEAEQNSYDTECPTVEGEYITHFGAHEQGHYLSKQHGELIRTYLMEQEGLSSPSSTKNYHENYDSYHYSNYHTMNKVQEDHNFTNGHYHGHTIFPSPSGNDEVPISKLETFGLSKDSSLISLNDDLEVTPSPFLASRSSSLMNQDRHNPDSVRIQSPNEEIQYNSVKATKDSFIPTELSSELYTFSNVSSQSFPKINSASDHKHIFEMPQHTSSSVASSIVPENSLISMKNSFSSHQHKPEPLKDHVEVQLEEKNNHIMSENLEIYNIEDEGLHSQQKLHDLPHSSHAKIKKSFNKKIVSTLKKKFSHKKSKKTHSVSDQMDHDIISRNTMISQSIPSIVTTEISTTNLQYGNLNHSEQVNYVVDRDRFQYNIETQTVTTASESYTGYSKTLRNMKAELVSVQQLLRNVMIDNSHTNTGNLPTYGRTEGTHGVSSLPSPSTNNNTGRAVRNEGYNHVSDSISHNEISGRGKIRNPNATVVSSIPAVTNYHHPNHTYKIPPMDHRKYYPDLKNDNNVILPQSEISRGFNSVEIPLTSAEIGHSEQIKHLRSLDGVAAVSTNAVRFLGSNSGAEEGDVRGNLYLSLSPSTDTYKKSNLGIEQSRANDTRVLDQYNSEFYGDKNLLRMTRTEVMSENIVDSNEKRDEELGLLRKERSLRNGWFE